MALAQSGINNPSFQENEAKWLERLFTDNGEINGNSIINNIDHRNSDIP